MSLASILSIGVSGVAAQAGGLEAVAHNIANSQTAGYKRVRPDFSSLVANQPASPTEFATGGAEVRLNPMVAEAGAILRTGVSTHLAIAGEGYFVVSPARDADALFTRAGDFTPAENGLLANGAGLTLLGRRIGGDASAPLTLSALEPVDIQLRPANTAAFGALTGVSFDEAGRLIAAYESGDRVALYEIALALFANPAALTDDGRSAFARNPEAGQPVLARPDEGRAGAIAPAAIEASTVDMGREFASLIAIQRAYAASAKIISAADALWRRAVETAA